MDKDNAQDIEEIRRQQQSAADLVRAKLNKLYADEPDAKEELQEVSHIPKAQMSKHQQYMQRLSSSGKSLAEIQTAWHEYYQQLPDNEKHEVWQEFYSEHGREKTQDKPEPEPIKQVQTQPRHLSHNSQKQLSRRKRKKIGPVDVSTAKDIKQHLIQNVQKRSKAAQNPHVKSLLFGLSMGAVTLFVLLFGFFNERFITPFIRPNSNVSATPIIVDPQASGPIGPESKIIIPKINVEAPVVYDVPSIKEEDVQAGLERGVVHYITTPNPGEKGNSVIFGHSSSNILNKGKYKFAFLLLKSLEKEDTFIIQKDGKRYVYKVYNKFVTNPQDLSVLGPTDKPAIMTLITCDPPGTSTNRLIIQAEQIFPDPSGNAESSVQQVVSQEPEQLPSNSVTLWQRIKNWF